jgi:hypothetical protein
MRILCIHGVGHGDADTTWQGEWQKAVADGIHAWDPNRPLEFAFSRYDDLFEAAPLHAGVVLEALARLAASGLFYGVVDLFRGPRGLRDTIDKVRWTAGMVAQWVALGDLRAAARERIGRDIATTRPDLILAHSLGSLIVYDTLRFDEQNDREFVLGNTLVTFGSQIGNPAVRQVFGGRIEELEGPGLWWNLYNEHDDVFTCPIEPATQERFEQIDTPFDIDGIADHDGAHYLAHEETGIKVWQAIGTAARALGAAKAAITKAKAAAKKTPSKATTRYRALLVGIADYPDPENVLGGPVNDVFLMSSVLQELDFPPDSIRVILNERATCKAIRERFAWLVGDARDGDTMFFFYAGHGTQIPAFGSDAEVDHIDECLVPYDFDWQSGNAITDDEFAGYYGQLPYGSHFVAVLDCCHSGGMARAGGHNVRGLDPPDDIRHRSIRWNKATQMWVPRAKLVQSTEGKRMVRASDPRKALWVGKNGDLRRIGRASSLWLADNRAYEKARKAYGHFGPYTPILYEACKENEYAYEYRHGSVSHGAFTFSLCQELRDAVRIPGRKALTFGGLLGAARNRIRDVVTEAQTPQLICPDFRLKEHVPGL